MNEFDLGIIEWVKKTKDSETSEIGITPDMIRKSKVLMNL